MPSVQEINDIQQLGQYRLLWNSLVAQTCHATFFHTLEWLEAYWRHHGEDQKLRVLVVWAGAEPIGILPLVVRGDATRIGRVRVLGYPLCDWGSFYGPIGPNPTATLVSALSHIHETRRDWDLLDLRYVDADGVDQGRTPDAMCMAGFYPHPQTWARVALIDLDGTWQSYWCGRSHKWRHNINRCRRRIAELGQVRHVRYRPEGIASGDGDPRWDLYEASVRLAEKSWQGSSTTGTTLSHASVRPFLDDVHAVAAATGSLDLNLLMVDDQPVAFAYNYHYLGWVSGLRMGFDPQFGAAGPGAVLLGMIVEDSFRRGDRTYDLGVGSLRCKERWQTSVATSARYTHFPPSVPRANLLRAKRWLVDHLYGSDYVQYDVRS